MNLRIFSAASAVAVALIASAASSQAKTYTPAQFKAELTAKVGTKKDAAAYTAASTLLKTALSDKANKKNIAAYVTAVVAVVKKSVSAPQTGKSAIALVTALSSGYFAGASFNPTDAKFVAALKSIEGTVAAPLRSPALAKQIAAPVLALNKAKLPAYINSINNTVYTGLKQTPPTPVS